MFQLLCKNIITLFRIDKMSVALIELLKHTDVEGKVTDLESPG
jgi:hypothetical protein